MAEAEYEAKRDPNMGSRSTLRHGGQAGVSAGGLAMLLQALVEAQKIDVHQAFLLLAILTPIATTAWKAWDQLGLMARLRGWLDAKGFKAAPVILALLIPLAGGCAIQLGTATPHQFSTLNDGTLIACETKGILLAIGDADLCSNSARGGHVSRTFADMTLGVVRTVGSAVAGFFGGAGRGMADALEADRPVEVPAPPAAAPAEPATSSVDLTVPTNPFVAPDPN